MNPDYWRRVEELYKALVDLSPAARSSALDNIADTVTREKVRTLLDIGFLPGAFRPSAADELDGANQRFGPWRTTRLLGYGGMGAVYEAIRDDHVFEKKVAIKILHTGHDSPAARERFRQEREILANLNHPNIAHLIDGGETTTGISYIVMEFVDGQPLGDWCTAHRATREQILRLFLKICQGVQSAHQRLVIHRDLKPANILVTPDGTPKILDFGIAKLLDGTGDATRTGFHALTPAFASPEQVLAQPVSTASDVYSLGVILYLLLTGRSPCPVPPNASPLAITNAVCSTPPQPPGLSTDLDNILMMALRKEPERRYDSVSAFAADIENFLAHRVVIARDDTLWYRTSKFVRRNSFSLTAAAAVVVALAGGVVASQYQAHQAQKRFDQVRGLANHVLDVDTRLADTPGTTQARKELLATVLTHLRQLSETRGDPALESELASAYLRAGTIQGSLAESGKPKESYERAIELGERVRSGGKADRSTLLTLAQSYFRLGITFYDLSDYASARRILAIAIDRAQDPAAQPGGASIVASACSWLSRMEGDDGAIAKAVEWSEKAVVASEEAVRADRNPATREALINSQLNLGRPLRLAGELERAAALSAKAAAEGEALHNDHPGNQLAVRALLEGYLGADEGYSHPFDFTWWTVPREKIQKVIEISQRMAAAEPNSLGWSNFLLDAWLQLSNAEPDDRIAEDAARKALAIVEKQIAQTRTSAINTRNRTEARIQLAYALRRTGKRAEALQEAALAIDDLSRNFADRESRAATLRARLVQAYVELDSGRPAPAAQAFEAARAIADDLVKKDATDRRMAAFLGLTYEGLGRSTTGPPALAWLNRAAGIWKSWPSLGKTTRFAQDHLAQTNRWITLAPPKPPKP